MLYYHNYRTTKKGHLSTFNGDNRFSEIRNNFFIIKSMSLSSGFVEEHELEPVYFYKKLSRRRQ